MPPKNRLCSPWSGRTRYAYRQILRGVVCLAAIVCLPALSGHSRALADNAAEAEALFKRGQKAAQKMQWPTAYKLFKRCYELQPSYDIAANLGQVAMKAGHTADGAYYLWKSLQSFPLSERASRRAGVERMFNVAKQEVTTITLTTDPRDAEVSVNGEVRKRSPGDPLFLEPGKHIITAEAEGYEPFSQPVAAKKGTELILDFVLERSDGSVPAQMGAPSGEQVEESRAPKAEEVEPGVNEAPPEAPVLEEGPAAKEAPSDTAGKRELMPALLIGGAVTAVGLAVGIGYTLSANSTESDAQKLDKEMGDDDTLCGSTQADPRCAELKALAKSVDSDRNVAYVGFGVAGAAAVATVLYLFWPTEQETGALKGGFVAGAQHAEVLLSGSF